MIDKVVHRHQLRATLSRICSMLMACHDQPREASVETIDAPRIAPPHNGSGGLDETPVQHDVKPNGHANEPHAAPEEAEESDDAPLPAVNGADGTEEPAKPAPGDTQTS